MGSSMKLRSGLWARLALAAELSLARAPEDAVTDASASPAQAEILWLMAAKTKWQDSEAKKHEAESARKAGDEKRAAQLGQQTRELLEAARRILNSANVSNPGVHATELPALEGLAAFASSTACLSGQLLCSLDMAFLSVCQS